MGEYGTYINVLVTSLRKKHSLLEEIMKLISEEEKILKTPDISLDEIEVLQKEKGQLLESLELADEGFEKVYRRVKEEFEQQKYNYESEIKEMQVLIKKITDLTVKVQAQEIRNKQLVELFFQQKKQEVRSYKNNTKTVNQYHQHMANRGNGQSFFMDNKR